jgi:exopolysaccharide biosynthesis polyprenyl glycosylphosphotransferase
LADATVVKNQDLVVIPEGPSATMGERPKHTSRRYARLSCWIAVSDAAALIGAISMVHLVRGMGAPASFAFLFALVAAAVVWVGVFAAFGLYSFSRLSPAEEFRRIVEATGVAVGIKLGLALLFGKGPLVALSRGWLVLTWLVSLILVMAFRQLWHKRMWRLRVAGELCYRTLIIGANDEGVRIAHTLRPRALGFLPLGLLATTATAPEETDSVPVLGTLGELAEVIQRHGIECVFVASSAVSPEVMKRLTKLLRRHDVEIRVSANMTDILSSRLTVQPVADLLALSLKPVRLSGPQALAKRSFDLAVAWIAVVLSSPIWLASAALIKATSRGPVLFKQARVGKEGKLFTMYKFRTMIEGAEYMISELEAQNEASGPLFKMRRDPRVTRVGKWLRRWSLDELPQLLNVLRGDMSLVGPRPPLPKEVATYEDWHRDRLEVHPGITGLWQTGGRSELSFDDYVRLDLFYIENWSVTFDLYILAKTIPAVLFSRGAF